MGRFVLGLAVVAGLYAVAGANGRPAATATISFQQGNPDHIVAGMTFGLLLSDDGGVTWHWMCEKAVGYAGMYDPDYAYSQSGAVFATTFSGFKVMRDRCTFAPSVLHGRCAITTATICTVNTDCPGTETCEPEFVSHAELGPDHNLHVAAADPHDSAMYKSIDDGVTLPLTANPGMMNDWWDSLVVAPSNPMRIYLTGYRLIAGNPKEFLLFRSDNGGTSYTPMSTTGFTTSNNSSIDIVGVDPANADIVYAHANLENGNIGDSIYKSTNGGGAWTKILTKVDPFGLFFVVRTNGDLVAATTTMGAVKSSAGATCVDPTSCAWTDLVSPPHINCLVEHPATHEVWACTHNYDSPGVSGDGYGIMKTNDYVTWSPVLHFQDIAGPVDCPAGTVMRDQCVESYAAKPSVWCCLAAQLGFTSQAVDCTGPRDCGVLPDSPPDAGDVMIKPKGCCESSGGGPGFLVLGLGVAVLLWRRKR